MNEVPAPLEDGEHYTSLPEVSKRDLYANFPNKQAVLLQCITNRAARMQLSADLPAPRSREMLAQILVDEGAQLPLDPQMVEGSGSHRSRSRSSASS